MRLIAPLFALIALAAAAWMMLRGEEAPVDALTPEPAHAAVTAPAREAELLTPEPRAEDPAPALVEPPEATLPLTPAPAPVESIRAPVEGATEHVWSGTVVDEETGSFVADVTIRLESEDKVLVRASTGTDGRFTLSSRSPLGRTLFAEDPDGMIVVEPRVDLYGSAAMGGEGYAFVVRRWPPEPAGDITGHLLSESGPWHADGLPDRGTLVLDLISKGEPRIERRAEYQTSTRTDGTIELSFVFRDVPRGEYELTLSELKNFRWYPTSLSVSPPSEGLEFIRYDKDRTVPLVFRVFDKESGAPIEDYSVSHLKQTISEKNGVFMHAGALDASSFPADGAFRWSLWADSYAPAFGNEESFSLEDGRRVAEVYLVPGWSTRLIVLGPNPTMRPLEGAAVYVDGEEVGATGDDGSIVLTAEERPDEIDVRYRDWVTVPRPQRATAAVRGHVTAVMLRPPE